MKKAAVIFSLLSPLLALPANSNPLQYEQVVGIDVVIQQIISVDTHPILDNKVFQNYKKVLDDLYFLSPQHLLWIDSQTPDKQKVTLVLDLITKANESGLNAEHYNLTNLTNHWQQLKNKQIVSYTEMAVLDTAISINLIHLLSDLRFGRINPLALVPNYNSKKNAFSLIPIILEAIAKNKVSLLSSQVEPSNRAYHQLKKVLLEYKNKESGQAIKKLPYITLIHPNDLSPQIIEIRQQLNLLGISSDGNNPSFLYDQELSNQIKKLQFHHGLKEDGIIGRNTIKALNTPISQGIQKIKLALERFRWLPETATDHLIMVNIPAFQLTAYHLNSNNKIPQSLDMKVIVGKSKDTKSPVFTANMYYLEFSPYWNIPKSITFDEILPKLQEDPLYLEQHNMELVTGFHNDEVALPYEEGSFAQLQAGKLMIRQRPGKDNSLGRVKFIFPNNYNVYLHDTPSRHLFRKAKRDLSHGCIRVEKPTEHAHFLLQTKRGWDKKEITKAMQLSSPKKVRLKKAVPVIIYYSTASIVQGEVVFYNDIYNYDTKLSHALMEHNKLPLIPLAKTDDLLLPNKL